MARAETHHGNQEGFSVKRASGATLEYGGAIFGIIEAVSLDAGGALVGGAIWLLGRWIRYSGENR